MQKIDAIPARTLGKRAFFQRIKLVTPNYRAFVAGNYCAARFALPSDTLL